MKVARWTQKKMSAVMVLLAAALSLTGCRYENGVITQETPSVIEEWLAYKAQVEDTNSLRSDHEQMQSAIERMAETSEETNAQTDAGDALPGQEQVVNSENEALADPAFPRHGFYYQYLSDSARVVYDEILNALWEMKEARISTLSSDLADMAFQCVTHDHPEIFYVDGYHLTQKTLDGQIVELSLSGQYNCDQEQRKEKQGRIDEAAGAILAGAPDTGDEYEKVKYVFDYLITHTAYNLAAPDNQNICSVLLGGESVCQGYAEAAQYLLSKMGIEAAIVTGYVSDGGRHAWNLVSVNGAYYYMDVTWGDVDYRVQQQEQERPVPVNYDYFLVTTAMLEKTHVIETLVTMPACV
ncbi:MAG: hypothetical protein J6P60_02890, partial [Lachnospiraceae bacterium]|nr:hypothetical protein [Lachnospiraceae bacterium]